MHTALAYVHIPKAGGRSVNTLLARSYGVRHCYLRHYTSGQQVLTASQMKRVRLFYPRLDSIAGHLVKVDPVYSDHFARRGRSLRYFTFVRDPYKRLISEYYHQSRAYGDISLEKVARKMGNSFMKYLVGGEPNHQKAIEVIERDDFVLAGMQEHYDESMLLLKQLYGDSRLDVRYQRENIAPKKNYPHHLLDDPEVRALIEEHSAEDLALYKYVRDEYFPAKLAAYDGDLEADLAAFRNANANLAYNRRQRASKLLDKAHQVFAGLHSGQILTVLHLKRYSPDYLKNSSATDDTTA